MTLNGRDIFLRYAIHLITAAALPERKGKVVDVEDVLRVYRLFLDVRRSMQYLVEYRGLYMFSEEPNQSGEAAGEDEHDALQI